MAFSVFILYTGGMSFLHQSSPVVRAVMDVGSSAIRAILFEVPSAGALPRPIKKFVWELPPSLSPLRLVQQVKKSVGEMTKAYGIPEQVLIGVGPAIGEFAVQYAVARPEDTKSMLTRADIRLVYERLFADHPAQGRASVVAPIALLVNGYSLFWRENGYTEAVLPRDQVQEICFRTLGLSMTLETGVAFVELKQSMAAVSMTFLPLAVAEKEAVTGLGVSDALIVDIGGSATTLILVRAGEFIHAACMPFGVRRVAHLLKDRLPGDTDALVRQYTMGIGDERLRAEVSSAATRVADEWKQQFVSLLDVFYAAGPLSPNVFVCGGGARLREIRAAAEARDWLGGFSYTDSPSVRVLEGATLFRGDTLAGNLQGPEDTGLAALMLYSLRQQAIF